MMASHTNRTEPNACNHHFTPLTMCSWSAEPPRSAVHCSGLSLNSDDCKTDLIYYNAKSIHANSTDTCCGASAEAAFVRGSQLTDATCVASCTVHLESGGVRGREMDGRKGSGAVS